jgi:hypothetical protein
VICAEGGTPGKERKGGPRCTPKEVELKLEVKDVVPKERFATAQNQDRQEGLRDLLY